MTLIELRNELRALCEKEGGALPWAKKHRISHSYVSAVIRGDANPGRKILNKMGKARGAKLMASMRFEDI